jgi:2-polyprenyl-6-methoxyphenol hydroxylase-like FAD-dependent oxidoreductase
VEKPDPDRSAGRHAVVVGGSIAGLIATRALANHFGRVTLIERDPLPDQPEARKGVPQMRHVHVLLKRGETILAEFFPGLVEELRAAGANLLDMAGDTRWYHFGGWKPRFQSGMEFLSQSRPLLEWKIRRRVAQTPGVEILQATDVRGFLYDASRSRVAGVRIVRAGKDGREERVYRLARTDGQVSRRFLQVMHLMAKPTILFEPYVLRRVLLLGPESRSVASPAPSAEATQPTG